MEGNEREPLLGSHDTAKAHGSCEFVGKKPFVYNEKVGWCERRRRKKALAKYYENQERLMRLYVEDEELLNTMSCPKAMEDRSSAVARKRKMDGLLASISFGLNVVLLFANATAAFLSGSLSIISTFVDSLVDMTSGVMIMLCSWAIRNTDMFTYPRGRTRLELVVVLMCSTIMGVANIMIIIQSVVAIIGQTIQPDANIPTIALIVGGCTAKIVLFSVCYRHGTPSSKILALDQRNDMVTSAVALIAAFIGDRFWVYADPIGAICVCTFISFSWFYNAFDNIPMMVGRRAQTENLSRIMRICMEHDNHITCLDHVMVYHTGAEAIVEVHIVLDEHLSLKISHDIIESLTKKLTILPYVERAFVHGDYRCDGDWQV